MALVIKSVGVQRKVWEQLRINAELSGVTVRDFLSYLIVNSRPVQDDNPQEREQLLAIGRANKQARQAVISPFGPETLEPPPPAPTS